MCAIRHTMPMPTMPMPYATRHALRSYTISHHTHTQHTARIAPSTSTAHSSRKQPGSIHTGYRYRGQGARGAHTQKMPNAGPCLYAAGRRHWALCAVRATLVKSWRRCLPSQLLLIPFDSKWVPPVGGAPSRHTGTGGAADGVRGTCPVPEGPRCWGQEPSGAPKQAARRSRVAPRSKQLGRQPDEAMSSRASG
jgi:hypothetical protein